LRHSRAAAVAALIAVSLAGCTAAPAADQAAARQDTVIGTAAGSLDGVYEPGSPGSYANVTRFSAASGTTPKLTLYYSGWWEKFQARFATAAWSHGAYTLVQLQPSVPLAEIARGYSDKYLRSYAAAVKAFGHPVVLSFAHEMNGSWYSWGDGHTPPSVFIAAWRHMVTVFRQAGVSNVTWLWTVNSIDATAAPLSQWWPGAAYVNWVGVDGYYYRSSDTFRSVFGTTVAEIRTFTRDPVLISETAVGPVAGPAKIAGLFGGVAADHLLGLVWFDEAQHDGIYHQDWRLEGNPAALAAFRAAAQKHR
jgi:mannan endo-1,4-beta-mannosidase